MIELRNTMVHSNSIADRNMTLIIGNVSINTYTGKMIQIAVWKYPKIVKVLVAYLKSHTADV